MSVIEVLNQARLIPQWGDDPGYALPWLQRWPLRTNYHTIAEDVAKLYADLAGRPGVEEVALFVDGTGVGTAVTEILAGQPAIKAGRREVVTITAGREVTRVSGGWHVAKGELVSVAQVALQRGKLAISPHPPEARTLREELAPAPA